MKNVWLCVVAALGFVACADSAVKNGPLMIAHRGQGDLTMPEHSLAAYRDAVAHKMDIVKLDLQRTKDGVLVMCHDDTLERLMGWNVLFKDVTYAEILEKGRYLDKKRKPTNEKIVRFDEALEIVKGLPEFWIDFKNPKAFDADFAEAALAALQKAGISQERVMLATFTVQALAYFKEKHPNIRRVGHIAPGLCGEGLYDFCGKYGLWGVNMPGFQYQTTHEAIRQLKERGLWVAVWIVNKREIADFYRHSGADAFVTDYVSRVRFSDMTWAPTHDFAPVRKKYIAHGWDMLAVSPEEVLANAEALDRLPIDGVTLMINKKLSDGRQISQETIMNDPPWPREELQDQIAVFRKIVKHPSLKESFISSWWAPQKRLDWTDDAAWARFAANMATVAWLAKEGGLKGILVDAEDYPKTEQYFRRAGDLPYDELALLARWRGAQVFKAMFDEFPEAVILSFWMLTLHDAYFESASPMAMAKANGDLWPHFVNGMLDVIPPTARFVDGNEHAYLYKSAEKKFHRSACQQRSAALGLVAKENRQKYLALLRAGFGLYLDSYIASTNSQWYLGPINDSRLEHFAQNLAQATEAADEYVWIYGEKNTWIKWRDIASERYRAKTTWDETLPGFNDVLLRVKSPQEYLRRQMMQLCAEGKGVNLARAEKRQWSTWHNERKAPGTMGKEGTGVFLEGVGSGCHMVSVRNVKGGEIYAVRMKMKGTGGSAVVYWQKDEAWQWQLSGFPVVFAPGTDEAWRTGEVLAYVPKGANVLVLQLGAKQEPGQRVVFDEVEIVKLSPFAP